MIIAIYCQFSDCSEAFCLYAIRHILIDSTFDGGGVVFLLATGYWLLATGYCKCNIPRSIAIVTACVRSDAPSFARIF
jgi:hypothetical protein